MKGASIKDADVLNLTDEQIDQFILISERNVAEGLKLVQEKETPYREAEVLYKESQAEWEVAKSKLTEDQLLLAELTRYRNRNQSGKDSRLLRTTSHLESPRNAKSKEFQWIPLAIEVLKSINRFVYPQDLYTMILQSKPELFKGIDKSKLQKEVKPRAVTALKKAAEIKIRKRGKQELTTYKERIGLVDWLGEGQAPKAPYIKEFMFSQRATA